MRRLVPLPRSSRARPRRSGRRAGAADRAGHQGRPPRRRRPHRQRGDREAAAELQRRRSAGRSRSSVAGRPLPAHDAQAKLKFDAPLTAAPRPPRSRAGRAARPQLGPQGRAEADRPDRVGRLPRAAQRDRPHHAAPHDPQALAKRPQPRRQGAARHRRGGARQPRPASSRVIHAEAQGPQGEGHHRQARAQLPDGHHHRPRALQAPPVQALKFVKSYGVAVGQPAYPTPTGLFSITTSRSTRPGRRRTRRGPASWPAPRRPAAAPRTRCGALDGDHQRRRHPRHGQE